MASLSTLSETTVEGLHEPLSPVIEKRLRRAVLDHTATEHRRSFLPLVHLGIPGGKEVAHAHREDEPTDPWLRADIIHSMRRRVGVPDPIVWLTRPAEAKPETIGTGSTEIEDVDLRWLAAARQAFREIDAPLTYVVVTRNAWFDPRSGVSRRWKRLRYRND
ncbi:hypothetical protein [Nocardioides luteus]|uniref:Uncharacterized protein n=1 Tax=Nocardioides luteus TaxID=1844 RepID=A0A1J4MYS1_9ACTN|nr:hypothetical protein [Nocardioides luteus]OIJ24427.1 hypothetical protein UG56_022845 [Nocardioides luteus]